MTRKRRFGQELDASPVKALLVPQGSQPLQKQIETLRNYCQLRNADDSYRQLFLSEIERVPTGNARG
jgi:hypothetical protein